MTAGPLLVVGAGGLGRETVECVRALNAARPTFDIVGFLDDDPALAGTRIGGTPVVGTIDDVSDFPEASVVVATATPSDPARRRRIVERLALPPERYATVVHPSTVLPATVQVGAGCILLAGVVVTEAVRVGAHVVVMPTSVLTHDDSLGAYTTVASGVRLGGAVELDEGSYLGAGALVREGTRVGAGAVIGMGAVVLGDVPAGEVWVGNPARPLRASEARGGT